MAQPAPTPFAVDSDITPLQGRYFESVTQNVSDPKLRTQLYDKVRATFGGIQQARDIQRAKAQEEEERTLSLELRRAQLDNSRMELGLARDRVRQQQEATAKSQEFNTALEDFQNYELPGLGAEEARSRVNLLGSQYSDVIAAVPAAKAKIDLFNNAFEGARRSNAYEAAREAQAQRQQNAEAKKKFQVDSAIAAGATAAAKGLVEILDSDDFDFANNFDEIDAQLKDLDKAGYVDADLRPRLREQGIYALETAEVPAEEKTGKYSGPNKVNQTEQIALLKELSRRAKAKAARKGAELIAAQPVESTAPAPPAQDEYEAAVPPAR